MEDLEDLNDKRWIVMVQRKGGKDGEMEDRDLVEEENGGED